MRSGELLLFFLWASQYRRIGVCYEEYLLNFVSSHKRDEIKDVERQIAREIDEFVENERKSS